MNWPIFLDWMKQNTLLFIYSTNILVRLVTVNMKNCLTQKNPKMCDPILVTLLKMQPHFSQSSRENATLPSGTSPLACYKEVPFPSPPPEGCWMSQAPNLHLRGSCWKQNYYVKVFFTWVTTVNDDAGSRLLVAPSVIDVAVPEVARGLLTWLGWVCNTLVVDVPAEDAFWENNASGS